MNLSGRYQWVIGNANLDATKKLELISTKKYQRYTSQAEIELNYLYDQIPVLAIFVRHLRKGMIIKI